MDAFIQIHSLFSLALFPLFSEIRIAIIEKRAGFYRGYGFPLLIASTLIECDINESIVGL